VQQYWGTAVAAPATQGLIFLLVLLSIILVVIGIMMLVL
jgi:hypothetical protein